ncbi:MAG: 30S ribosome-binding factor RbfA [Spirochaetes bacterium]|nr:30S ribosome-binding factor RbfA [Spirochaetota bacterium]
MAYRKEKLEEQIKRLVSEILIRDIKDPRIGFVTLTGVELNADYSVASIGVSVLGDERELRRSLEGLESARGYIQSRVGKAMRLRHTPKFDFFPDSSIAEGVRMVGLLDSLESEDSAERASGDELPGEDEAAEED